MTAALLGGLALLVCYSVYLALTRIYQVDECQNLYMAKVFAAGQASEFSTTSSLFLFGPLSWISQLPLRSAGMITVARLVFLVVFWFNLLLLAAIASGRLFSFRGLMALLGAATLAPLWDYGFEIRHDNVILTGVLLIWWLTRVKSPAVLSYVITGTMTTIMLFIAVKTVVYVVPLSLAIVVFPPPGHHRPRWQLSLAWIGGALAAVALVRLGYGAGSAWDQYLNVFRHVSDHSASGGGSIGRSWPWDTLARLLIQTPLLLALTVAGGAVVVTDLIRRGKAALGWEGILPETLLLLGALAALMTNPTPFPYNLVHVVPYAFLLAFRYGDALRRGFPVWTRFWPCIAALLVFVHAAPFALASQRHLERPNARQQLLMRLAEDLTDAEKDPVYDGIGMVLTRRSIHRQWYLHSLNIRRIINTSGLRVRDMLAARPAAVFIPSYRTTWLPEEDHEFLRQRYVPLADDFWVLGKVLPAGGGDFEIFHPGRYRIVEVKPSPAATTAHENADQHLVLSDDRLSSGALDGTTVPEQPVELTVGVHRLETAADSQPAVIWVGPHLDDVPRPGPGNHRTLFWNWY